MSYGFLFFLRKEEKFIHAHNRHGRVDFILFEYQSSQQRIEQKIVMGSGHIEYNTYEKYYSYTFQPGYMVLLI